MYLVCHYENIDNVSQAKLAILDENVKSVVFSLLSLFSDMGADSQSPLGTAFAFSRPNKVALSLSNTSLLLEYTSRVFLNSLQE